MPILQRQDLVVVGFQAEVALLHPRTKVGDPVDRHASGSCYGGIKLDAILSELLSMPRHHDTQLAQLLGVHHPILHSEIRILIRILLGLKVRLPLLVLGLSSGSLDCIANGLVNWQ